MKVTLTQVTRQAKQGANGDYIRLLIKTQEYGDKLLSGFGGAYTDQWKKGDVVDIEVEEVDVKGKKYLNFKPLFPKKENGLDIKQQLDQIEEKLDKVIEFFASRE